jgi:hypothetical protein
MKQGVALIVACTLLMVGVLAGCFLGAVLLIDHQVQTNRHDGARTRVLICELVRHDRLPSRGC